MAEANAAAGTGTPAAQDTTTQTTVVVAAPAAVAPAPAQEPIMSTEALNARLDQKARSVRNDLLRELGVEDIESAKATIAEAKTRAAAAKTTEQKLSEAEARAAAAEAEAATATALVADEVAAMLEELPPHIQERVKAAGNSPVVQKAKIKEIADLFDAAGLDLFTDKPPAAAATATATTPKPAPANTAPAPTAPPAAGATDIDHKAVYRQLEQENPVRAAAYLSKHVRQIYPSQ